MRRRLAVPLLAVAVGAVFSLPAGASLRQIAVGNFYFQDETVGDGKIDAQVGDQLRFNVLDGGPGTPHTVEVDELGIHSGSLGSGETFTTPPIGKAGTFILYCKPHDQRGHVTTLVVSGTSITTTTTQPPTTTTTQASTTTKPPATTTTTARPAGAVSSSSPTTTAPRATTTTAPPTSTSGTAGGSTAPTAGGTDPATGTSTTTSGNDPAPGADGTAPTGAGETALAPTGRGRVDDALAGPDGTNLDALLERMRGRQGPWTRSLRLSLAALVPMALAAALALRRWPGPPPADDAEA